MNKSLKLTFLCLSLFLLSPLFFKLDSHAAKIIVDESNPTVDDYISENLYIRGENITINDNVNGDITAYGGKIVVNEDIYGDFLAAGANIVINADVNGNVTCSGFKVEILGNVSGDLTAGGGTVSIEGDIGEDVRIAGGQVVVKSEEIGGDLFIGAARGKIDPSTEVEGTKKVEFSSQDPFSFEYFKNKFQITQDRLVNIGLLLLRRFLVLLGWIIVAVFLFKIAPVKSKGITDLLTERKSTLKSLILGFVSLLAFGLTLPLVIALAIVGIGQPAALLTFMLTGLALTIGGVYSSTALIKAIIRAKRPNYNGYIIPMIIGVSLYQILGWLPWYFCCMGPIVKIIVTIWGLGGVLLYKWNAIKKKL